MEIKSREDLFQEIQKKNYNGVIDFLKTNHSIDKTDPIIQSALGHFFNELINDKSKEQHHIFTQLFNLTSGKSPFYVFPDQQYKEIVLYLVKSASKRDEAYFYAKNLPNDPECAICMAAYEKEIPREMNHAQNKSITVKELTSENENITSSIFNSNQEKLFYFALRNCYPTHFIYPNMSLSTIINFALIENAFSITDKKYFYNTTVDFVLIDQFNDFKPMLVFELDSEWHRINNQKEKDDTKNRIIRASGLPLYRIEHFSKYKTVDEFEKVILEIAGRTK